MSQSILVKVHYSGKTIIIGKGIESQLKIRQQLMKRFPQLQINTIQLSYQFGSNLTQAYKHAQEKDKKSIKVNAVVSKDIDKTLVIKLAENDFQNDQYLVHSMKQAIPKLEQCEQKLEPAQASSASSQLSAKSSQPSSNISPQPNPLIPSQSADISINKNEFQNRQQVQLDEQDHKSQIKDSQDQQDEINNKNDQIDQIKMGQIKIDQIKVDQVIEVKQYQIVEKEAYFTQEHPVIQKMIKNFMQMFSEQQKKYNDLLTKYDSLKKIADKYEFEKSELKNEPKTKHQTSNKTYTLKKEYLADIRSLDKKDKIKVGEDFEHKVVIKNIGKIKWPSPVFLKDKNSEFVIQIKSLDAGSECELCIGKQRQEKPGHYKKYYELIYYGPSDDYIVFGRDYELTYQVCQVKNSTHRSPIYETGFQQHIQSLKKRLKMDSKDTKKIIKKLHQFGIDKNNYKQIQDEFLIDVIMNYEGKD